MAGSRRRRQQKQRQKLRALEAARRSHDIDVVGAAAERLPPDVLAEIHHRLPFLRRLAFASVCGASGHTFKQEAPWLLVPGETEETATVLSVSECAAAIATVRTSDPAMRGHVVLGSGGGWLVTADERATLRMANPATGAHAEMPAIATIPFLTVRGYNECRWFTLDGERFLQVRFGGGPPPEGSDWALRPPRSYTLRAAQMRRNFYRKVVLSASPRPDSYAAMLITDRHIGSPAFAAADDPVWRMAPSRDGVEDAIHHDGRFLSITYTGDVEAWDRDADTGEVTSAVVAPRLGLVPANLRRKYVAVAPDGQLMAVLRYSAVVEREDRWPRKATRVRFEVRVLDEEHGRWDATWDIGDAALFVGVNGSLCVSTREHPGVRAGCVYFTDDEVGEACALHEQGSYSNSNNSLSYRLRQVDDDEVRSVGVYSMKDGNVVETIYGPGQLHGLWPPAVWFTPSFL